MHTLSRLNLCALICLLPTGAIGARLVTLQVINHENYSSRVQSETERHALEIIPRGRILDRAGLVLAESLPSWSSTLDLGEAKNPSTLIRSLAPSLGLTPEEISALLTKARAKKRTIWLKRKMTLAEMERLKALKIPSLGFVPDEQRFYPNGALARPVLGSVGSDGKGNAGLELAFERRLNGGTRKVELTRDRSGHGILKTPAKQAAAPPDLRLTLDRAIQFFAETAIEETVSRYQAKRGMVLVQDPRSGDILAMAAYPSDPLKNGPIQDVFEPGSTFKIVTAAAALERKLLGPDERIDCEGGRWQLTETVAIKDHEPEGQLTLTEIISHSSNIGSGKIGLRLGAGAFARFCRLFGFGYKTGIPFPAESGGIVKVPPSADPVRLANAAFGQGVAVTPLQLVSAYSAVANDGLLMEPRLVLGLGAEPAAAPMIVRRAVSPETAKALRAMLEEVVEKGTGLTARIPGYATAGKTGTAQKLDPATGHYSPTDYVSSFAGYAPADDPQFTLLVIVDSPRGKYYGAEVAAPVFARLSQQILALRGVAPRRPLALKPAPGKAAKPASPAAASKPLPRPSILTAGG